MLARNLLRLRQPELVAVLVEDEHLLGPGLVNLAGEDLAHLAEVLVVEVGPLYVHNASLKVLLEVEYAPASYFLEHVNLAHVFVAYLEVVVHVGQGNLGARILYSLHYLEVLENLEVTLLVHDDVEIVG